MDTFQDEDIQLKNFKKAIQAYCRHFLDDVSILLVDMIIEKGSLHQSQFLELINPMTKEEYIKKELLTADKLEGHLQYLQDCRLLIDYNSTPEEKQKKMQKIIWGINPDAIEDINKGMNTIKQSVAQKIEGSVRNVKKCTSCNKYFDHNDMYNFTIIKEQNKCHQCHKQLSDLYESEEEKEIIINKYKNFQEILGKLIKYTLECYDITNQRFMSTPNQYLPQYHDYSRQTKQDELILGQQINYPETKKFIQQNFKQIEEINQINKEKFEKIKNIISSQENQITIKQIYVDSSKNKTLQLMEDILNKRQKKIKLN